jgi:hypothetical protein
MYPIIAVPFRVDARARTLPHPPRPTESEPALVHSHLREDKQVHCQRFEQQEEQLRQCRNDDSEGSHLTRKFDPE